MTTFPEGNAIVYCQGSFNTPNGKTAHGLVRFTRRYQVLSVIDSRHAGKDAGEVLDNRSKQIPLFASLAEAIADSVAKGKKATHLVVGLAPDGGRLSDSARKDMAYAIKEGLNIDSGLHDYLSEDVNLDELAKEHNVVLRDVRKTPPRSEQHFFSGKIEEVDSLKIALLGTDSAVGKRTTAWLLVQALEKMGISVEMVGTGQTAWMQGARYSLIMDSLINDFVSGQIEHMVWKAWEENKPKVIVIEGQGSLMNPAYPGGFEILAGGRPDIVVLQHAPARKEYDGFPGYPLHPLAKQVEAIELLSGKPVVAITLNHEELSLDKIPIICETIGQVSGLPTFDVLLNGADELAQAVLTFKK